MIFVICYILFRDILWIVGNCILRPCKVILTGVKRSDTSFHSRLLRTPLDPTPPHPTPSQPGGDVSAVDSEDIYCTSTITWFATPPITAADPGSSIKLTSCAVQNDKFYCCNNDAHCPNLDALKTLPTATCLTSTGANCTTYCTLHASYYFKNVECKMSW